MSSTVLFAQLPLHWGNDVVNVDGNSMTMTAQLKIDGVAQANTYLEIGMFSNEDGNCRATRRPANNPFGSCTYAFTFHGIEGETYTPRIWDWETGTEITTMTPPDLSAYPYHAGDILGNARTPIVLDFTTTSGQTFTLAITPYSGENDHYYLISSPVGDVDVDAVENLTSNEFDLYYFDQNGEGDETHAFLEWINYNQGEGQEPGFTQLAQDKGYLYANSGDDTGEDVILTFTGNAPELPSDDGYSIQLDFVEGTRLAGQNLIGNPFGEEIGINREFFVMNDEGTELVTADRDYLNPMEGAFVVALGEGESVILGGAGGSGWNQGGSFKVRVNGDRGCGDLAIIRFGQGQGLPKIMLNPEHTNICFPMSDADYAVVYADNMGEMPVNFKAEKNGSYTLSFSTENVQFGYLHLIDNMNGNDVDLLANPSYSFDARTTDYASRFKLVFATGNADDSFAFFSNGSFIISNDGNATLQVIDVNGRILKSETINGCANVNVNAASGVYMIRLINGDNVKVQKVVVR